MQCFACINTRYSPLPFHNMFYQVHFTDRKEAQKRSPAQARASYSTAEPGFKAGSAVQPLTPTRPDPVRRAPVPLGCLLQQPRESQQSERGLPACTHGDTYDLPTSRNF